MWCSNKIYVHPLGTLGVILVCTHDLFSRAFAPSVSQRYMEYQVHKTVSIFLLRYLYLKSPPDNNDSSCVALTPAVGDLGRPVLRFVGVLQNPRQTAKRTYETVKTMIFQDIFKR